MKPKSVPCFLSSLLFLFFSPFPPGSADPYACDPALLQSYESTILEYIVSLTSTGLPENRKLAFQKLLLLKDLDSHMGTLISTLYDGHPKNTAHIVGLLAHGRPCTLKGSGMAHLFQEMQVHGHLQKPEVLLLRWLPGDACKTSSSVLPTATQVEPFALEVMGTMADQIREGDFLQINRFLNTSTTARSALRAALPEIIAMVFSGSNGVLRRHHETVQTLLKFTNSLFYLKDAGVAYSTIIRELVKSGHVHDSAILHAAAESHRTFLLAEDKLGDHPNLRRLWDGIKMGTPPVIRNLLWSRKNCTVKNAYWQEYLFGATGEGVKGEGGWNGGVFTWMPGNKIPPTWWTVERYEKVEFQARLINNYLGGGGGGGKGKYNLCEGKGKVGTCEWEENSAEGRWAVIPVEWEYSDARYVFQLKRWRTRAKEGFLEAAEEHDLGKKRRKVRTGDGGLESYWQIECGEGGRERGVWKPSGGEVEERRGEEEDDRVENRAN